MKKNEILILGLDLCMTLALVGLATCAAVIVILYGRQVTTVPVFVAAVSFWMFLAFSTLAFIESLFVRKKMLSEGRQRWFWIQRVGAVLLFVGALPFIILGIWIYTHGGPT